MSTTTTSTRVFILEVNPRYSVQRARHFGQLRVLFKDGDTYDKTNFQAISDAVMERLSSEDFNPDSDLLCLTGDLVPISAMVAGVTALFGRFSVLQFNPVTAQYVVRHFDEEGLK